MKYLKKYNTTSEFIGGGGYNQLKTTELEPHHIIYNKEYNRPLYDLDYPIAKFTLVNDPVNLLDNLYIAYYNINGDAYQSVKVSDIIQNNEFEIEGQPYGFYMAANYYDTPSFIYDLRNYHPKTISNMQMMLRHATQILGLEKLDTSNVTKMSLLFYCGELKKLDISNFDTRNVTQFDNMFALCEQLEELNLGENFDTSNATTMNTMFGSCSKLKNIDLSRFNTSKATNMFHMFFRYYGTTLDLSSFDTTALEEMTDMFYENYYCTNLILSSKFFNSTKLTSYDFSGLSAWTDYESLSNFVNVLPEITSNKALQLSEQTKNALTDEQKQTINQKGWTIA